MKVNASISRFLTELLPTMVICFQTPTLFIYGTTWCATKKVSTKTIYFSKTLCSNNWKQSIFKKIGSIAV